MRMEEKSEIKKLLEGEGEYVNEKYIANTFILEDDGMKGFFTLKFETPPSLRYFYVKKNYRNAKHSRFLIKAVKQIIEDFGFNKFVIVVEKTYLKKIVEHYFKIKPYADDGKFSFYLAEV
jgi:hypothetical protein